MKSRLLIAYVVTVEVLAVGSLLLLPYGDLRKDPLTLVVLVILGALGSRPIRIPAFKMEVIAADAFIFAALAHLGGLPAAAVVASSVFSSSFARRPRPRFFRWTFNLSALLLPTVLAYFTFLATGGGSPSLARQILPLGGATTVYFLANTLLVSIAIALEKNVSVAQTWRGSGLWTAISTYTGLTLAACLLLVLEFAGPWGLALGIPPCWLLVSFYRTHKSRIEEQQRRIEQVVNHNTELEDKVNERTLELQKALSHIEERNEELSVINDRLSEANRAKSAFLANVSHELRTPLNAIIGFSELLGDGSFGDLNGEQRGFATDIHESGVHLLSLINDILDLCKIEAGKLELHREPVDIQHAIHEMVGMVRPQAAKKSLSLVAECPVNVTIGEVDPGMFRQILLNLLSNAVKFTPEKGSVRLMARRQGQDLLLDVVDTGIGIAEEDKSKIFEEFYQADGSYSRNYQGTGLGLALVRRLVHLHAGSVSMVSQLGQGTTFTLRFPSCLNATSMIEEPAEDVSTGRVAPTGRTILVVEDNPVNRKLAENVLKSRGFRVVSASSGEEAMELIGEADPELILMDIQLPGLDGLEVTRLLKSNPLTAGIPIVALSAHVQESDEMRALDAGCIGYIRKPIRLNRFPAEVQSFLEPRQEVA